MFTAQNVIVIALSFVHIFIFYNVFGEFVKLGPCLYGWRITCPDPHIKFLLYTRQNKNIPQEIQPNGNEILKSFFQPNSVNKIIIHGYNSDPNLTQLIDMKNGYLETSNHNVWLVDWAEVAKGPCYPIVVHNLNYVGTCIAQLISEITNVSTANPETAFHVLGFSIGAHAAAYTANNLRPYKLPRITGLDPALPLFVTKDRDQKLDETDAHFVDVLHTDAFVQGKAERCGHVDFYMNGGFEQPGCWKDRHIIDTLRCNHNRAPAYFAESITTNVGFWGWRCENFLHYITKKCPPTVPDTLMGEYCSVNSTGYYIVHTAAKPPYAIGKNYTVLSKYRIRVDRSNDPNANKSEIVNYAMPKLIIVRVNNTMLIVSNDETYKLAETRTFPFQYRTQNIEVP